MISKRLIHSWVKVFLWCALIFYLSSIPSLKTDFGIWDLILRKLAHITEYAVLFLLSFRAFKESLRDPRISTLIAVSFIFSLVYAVSDEIHQALVPGRGPSAVDVGIDSIGIIMASVITYIKPTEKNVKE